MSEKELTIEEKIKKIKESEDVSNVANSWFPPYYEEEYYFVSYSHKDYKLVYESLHRLQNGERHINVWYDHSLTPGRDWEKEAQHYIYDFNCKGVIFFISENSVLSQSIHKEIEFVKKSGKDYLSINLPCEIIKEFEGKYLSAEDILIELKKQGISINNYDEKKKILSETFNNKVTFLPFNENIDSQIDKILSLKREPLLNADNVGHIHILSTNDINITEIIEQDFEKVIQHNVDLKWIYVDEFAFANLRRLQNVRFPNRIVSLEIGAFVKCVALESIVFPAGVSSFEDYVFAYCENLKEVIMPDVIDGKYYGSNWFKGAERIGNMAFYACYRLENISIPNSVTSIGRWAFFACASLTSIVIPNSITSIGEEAFIGCDSLTIYCEVESKPEKWDNNWIGENRPVYWGVSKDDILIQDGIQYLIIDGKVGVTGHTNEIGSNVTIPANIIFGNKQHDVIAIGSRAFYKCESLQSITIPKSVIIIGNRTFEGCESLKSIIIPKSVVEIRYDAFCDCKSLTIYCEALSKPNGWNRFWNFYNNPVYWGGQWSYVDGVPTPNK